MPRTILDRQYLETCYDAMDQLRFQPEPHIFIHIQVLVPILVLHRSGGKSPDVLLIIGTLLGAVIGGFFSLVGSISVNKYQIRAQTQIRRKNLIYTPLYDELVEIHNIILKSNPYPDYIAFQKQQQTIIAHPQFAVWKTIKSDSRYLKPLKNWQEQWRNWNRMLWLIWKLETM